MKSVPAVFTDSHGRRPLGQHLRDGIYRVRFTRWLGIAQRIGDVPYV